MALSPITKLAIFLSVGTVMFIFGLTFGLVVRNRVDSGLKEAAGVCGEKDDSYDGWRTNAGEDDAKKYKRYFGFNVTNAVEYLQQGPTDSVTLQLNVHGEYAMRQRDTYYNVTFSEDKKTVSYKTWTRYDYEEDESCSTCKRTDRFTNLNPGLLTLMTRAGSELTIGLGFSSFDPVYTNLSFPVCGADQIKYSLGVPDGCDPTSGDPMCCCNKNALPTEPASCVARATRLWSQFAGFDNGVTFNSPIGLGPVNSALFLNKNIHEVAYGYPSALLGLLLGGQAYLGNDTETVQSMAEYTELAIDACNGVPAGTAPTPESMEGEPYQHLGLISCSPLQAVYYWAADVGGGNRLCDLLPLGACMCAVDPSRQTSMERPCCTLAGLGCLQKVTGYVSDEQYLTQDQSYIDYEVDLTEQNTGCGEHPEGEEFWWTTYESLSVRPGWADMPNLMYAFPTQSFVSQVMNGDQQVTYLAPVRGGDGTRMKGTGKTSSPFSSDLSDGSAMYEESEVFITQVYRSAKVYAKGSETYRGVKVVKYQPSEGLLAQHVLADPPGNRDNSELGAGTPLDGLQAGVYLYGFPVFISRPFFLYGNTSYLSSDAIRVLDEGKAPEITPEKYDTYLLVEPASGMTIAGHKRLMASFSVYRCDSPLTQACNENFSLANLLSPYLPGEVIVPQYYMDESSAATDDQVDQIKSVGHLSLAADVILLLFPLVGGVICIVGGVFYYRENKTKGRSLATSLMSDRD